MWPRSEFYGSLAQGVSPTIPFDSQSFPASACLIGLVIWYAAIRWVASKRGPVYYEGPGVWTAPPEWIRVVFGGRYRKVRLDVLAAEIMGLVWALSGTIAFILRPETTSGAYLVLELLVILSLPLVALVFVIVATLRRNMSE